MVLREKSDADYYYNMYKDNPTQENLDQLIKYRPQDEYDQISKKTALKSIRRENKQKYPLKQKSLLDFYETKIDRVLISKVIINQRIRFRINKPQINNLSKSIEEFGLLNPISITPNKTLIAGFHRLKACEQLGWSEIPCTIINVDDSIDLKILEIDENLLGPNLSVLERAEHLAERKRLYEQKHPETKKGINLKIYPRNEKGYTIKPGIPESGIPDSNKTFVKDTIEKTSLKRSAIYEDLQIAKIDPEVKKEIWDTELENHKTDLLKLSKLKPEKQRKVIKKLKKKKAKKVGEAIAQIKREEKLEEAKENQPEYQKVEYIPELYHQDALAFLDSIEDNSVDLLFTDPPYMKDIEMEISLFASQWCPRALEKVKDTGRIFIFTGPYPEEIKAYLDVLLSQDRFCLSNILIWTYRNTIGPSPEYNFKNNWQSIFYLRGKESLPLNTDKLTEKFSVLDFNAPDGRQANNFFKWQKPDELAELIIRLSSQENDFVVDPFAGSGTFVLKATEMKRYAKGSEINANIIKIAEKRGCIVKNGV